MSGYKSIHFLQFWQQLYKRRCILIPNSFFSLSNHHFIDCKIALIARKQRFCCANHVPNPGHFFLDFLANIRHVASMVYIASYVVSWPCPVFCPRGWSRGLFRFGAVLLAPATPGLYAGPDARRDVRDFRCIRTANAAHLSYAALLVGSMLTFASRALNSSPSK